MQTNVKWIVNWYRFRLKSHQINFHLSERLRSFNTDFCGQAVQTAHHCITHKTNWMPKNWSSNRDVHQMSMSLKIYSLFYSLSSHLIDRTTYVNYRFNTILRFDCVAEMNVFAIFSVSFIFCSLEIRTTNKEQLIGTANPSKNCQTKMKEKKKIKVNWNSSEKHTHYAHTHRIASHRQTTCNWMKNETFVYNLPFVRFEFSIVTFSSLRWNEMCVHMCVFASNFNEKLRLEMEMCREERWEEPMKSTSIDGSVNETKWNKYKSLLCM